MNRIVAIILFLGISFQSTVKLGIVAWYQVNKTYVATVLCENKNKPELNCCGKCYVTKQLNKADEHSTEKQAPGKNTKAETVDYIIYAADHYNYNTISFAADKILNGHYRSSNGYDAVTSIFHPPPVG